MAMVMIGSPICDHFRDMRNRNERDLHLQNGPVKSEDASRQTICDLISDGNSNVGPICHHFRDIHRRNVLDLDRNLQIGPRSSLNRLIDSQPTNDFISDGNSSIRSMFYPICHRFRDIPRRNVHGFHLQCGLQSTLNKLIETIWDFLFDGNSNVGPICHHFRDIHQREGVVCHNQTPLCISDTCYAYHSSATF